MLHALLGDKPLLGQLGEAFLRAVIGFASVWLMLSSMLYSLRLSSGSSFPKPLTLEEVEKRQILKTLEHTDWNKSQAAGILQIERSTLDRKIKSYQLKKDE